jgi:ATP-dependent Clp protease ATP-binding subunit ClpC
MFERFTERARKVMSLARQEAQRMNSEFIGSEHVLMGIIQEGGGVAAKVLKALQADLKRIREETDKLITPSSSPTVTLGQLPFSPRCKHVIEIAGEEAYKRASDVVGTEHLLIGIVREKEGIAWQVLHNLDISEVKVVNMVDLVLGADHAPAPVPPVKKECKHEKLHFQSGGFMIVCTDCGVYWIAMRSEKGPSGNSLGMIIDHARSEVYLGGTDFRTKPKEEKV